MWNFIITRFMRLNCFSPGRWAVCAADDQLRDCCVEILIGDGQTLSKRRRCLKHEAWFNLHTVVMLKILQNGSQKGYKE